MENFAYWLGSRIHWNSLEDKFLEEEANQLVKLNYNDDWKLPGI